MDCTSLKVQTNRATEEQKSDNVLRISEQQEPCLVKRKQSEAIQEYGGTNSDDYTSSRSVRKNLGNISLCIWLRMGSTQEDNQEHSASSNKSTLSSPSNAELTIKVQYGDQLRLHYSPHTSKLADTRKIFDEKSNLDTGS